jgi:beta-lactamase superfamily II metal-dependent hydrolase
MEYVAHDLVRVWKTAGPGRSLDELVTVLYRGDDLEVLDRAPALTKVRLNGLEAWVRGKLETTPTPLLAFAFIDVGQGDACLITTPGGQRVLVDGGENQLAARYLAARFWRETVQGRDVPFDAVIVTHGDADHFDGLSTLVLDAAAEKRDRKRINITARRVFHNGLVRRPSSIAERQQLGPTVDVHGDDYVRVVDDPRVVADCNRPFARWNRALDALVARGATSVSRLDATMTDSFNFLSDVSVTVLGPHVRALPDGSFALPLLGSENGTGVSASRTINGHSIVLKFKYGNVTALLTGDTHAAAQEHLRQQLFDPRADVFKVPHHGSQDVSRTFIEAVQPLVSVISAGDEDARRDYLHPRANLLAMLGQSRRGAEPVVFVTNLAAFDKWEGEAFYAVKDGEKWRPDLNRGTFYARQRTAYGIIHVRTDGERLVVIRRGARADRQEAYAYVVAGDGSAASSPITSI